MVGVRREHQLVLDEPRDLLIRAEPGAGGDRMDSEAAKQRRLGSDPLADDRTREVRIRLARPLEQVATAVHERVAPVRPTAFVLRVRLDG